MGQLGGEGRSLCVRSPLAAGGSTWPALHTEVSVMSKAAISPLPEARPFSFCCVISSCRTRSQEKRACLQHKTPRAHYKNACPLQREDQNWEGSGPALQGELA